MTNPEPNFPPYAFDAAADVGPQMNVVRGTIVGYGWTFRMPAPTAIAFILRKPKSVYDVMSIVDEERMTVGCYCSHPVRVPAARLGAVAEAIVRINWGLALGGFDFDFTDGEIRYRFAIDVEGGTLTESMVDNLIGCAVRTSERYHDALLRVAFGDGDPEVEIAGLKLTE